MKEDKKENASLVSKGRKADSEWKYNCLNPECSEKHKTQNCKINYKYKAK